MKTRPRRQPRNRRRQGIRVHLTERDELLLHALARFRLARTSDLLDYAFAGVRRDTGIARLRRLFDTKHLAVLPPRQGAENVYRLGPAGCRFLREQGVEMGRVPRGGLEHHLGVVGAWIALAGIQEMGLERCLPDWELREHFTVPDLPVIPDLFALVRFGESVYALAVEVDRGTENVSVLGRKLEVYRSRWGRPPGLFGYERFGIVVVSYGPARRSGLSATIKKAWVVPCVLWEGGESPRAVLLKLFEEMAGPLMGSPYLKGSLAATMGRSDG